MNRVIGAAALALAAMPAWADAPRAQAGPAAADDKRAVVAVVQKAVDEFVAALRSKELSSKQRRERVKASIQSFADLELLAKLTLGKTRWSSIDDRQRQEFTQLFTETILQSTYEKLELFTDEQVEVGEPEPIEASGSPKYRVLTWIISKGERTELALMLARREDAWKTYDLEIEGVSIRKSYGSQYADFLREKGFAELLEQMRKKVAEAQRKLAEIDAKESASGGRPKRQ